MTLLETLRLALDELVGVANGNYSGNASEAITALRSAIEQVEKEEPVAHLLCGGTFDNELEDWEIDPEHEVCERINEQAYGKKLSLPLYTTPQPRQWVSLTDDEIDSVRLSLPAVCKHQDVIRTTEAALRQKNGG